MCKVDNANTWKKKTECEGLILLKTLGIILW